MRIFALVLGLVLLGPATIATAEEASGAETYQNFIAVTVPKGVTVDQASSAFYQQHQSQFESLQISKDWFVEETCKHAQRDCTSPLSDNTRVTIPGIPRELIDHVEQLENQVVSRQEIIEESEGRIKRLSIELDQLETNLSALQENSEEERNALMTRIDAKARELSEAEGALGDALAQLRALENERSSLQNSIADLRTQNETLSLEKVHVEQQLEYSYAGIAIAGFLFLVAVLLGAFAFIGLRKYRQREQKRQKRIDEHVGRGDETKPVLMTKFERDGKTYARFKLPKKIHERTLEVRGHARSLREETGSIFVDLELVPTPKDRTGEWYYIPGVGPRPAKSKGNSFTKALLSLEFQRAHADELSKKKQQLAA